MHVSAEILLVTWLRYQLEEPCMTQWSFPVVIHFISWWIISIIVDYECNFTFLYFRCVASSYFDVKPLCFSYVQHVCQNISNMDRLLKPAKLHADPESPAAEKEYWHWLWTFQNFLHKSTVGGVNELSILVN